MHDRYMMFAALGAGGRPLRAPYERQGERPELFETRMRGRNTRQVRTVQQPALQRPAFRDVPVARRGEMPPMRAVYPRAYFPDFRAQRGAAPEVAQVRTDLQKLQKTVGAQQKQLAAWNQWAAYETRVNAAEQAARANANASKLKTSGGKGLMEEIFGKDQRG